MNADERLRWLIGDLTISNIILASRLTETEQRLSASADELEKMKQAAEPAKET